LTAGPKLGLAIEVAALRKTRDRALATLTLLEIDEHLAELGKQGGGQHFLRRIKGVRNIPDTFCSFIPRRASSRRERESTSRVKYDAQTPARSADPPLSGRFAFHSPRTGVF